MWGVRKPIDHSLISITLKYAITAVTNKAFQGYDKDIHCIAINKGICAFLGGNMDVSMEHFAAEKRVHHTLSRAGGHTAWCRPMRWKGPCEAWNSRRVATKGQDVRTTTTAATAGT